jgi:hypothetical protein
VRVIVMGRALRMVDDWHALGSPQIVSASHTTDSGYAVGYSSNPV